MTDDDLMSNLSASIPGAKFVANGRQILCRCPKCGDSATLSNAHFYIGPIVDRTEPLQFNCKKCDASGLFSFAELREFGIYDLELGTALNEYNSQIMKTMPNNFAMYSKGLVHNLQNTFISDSRLTRYKLDYVRNRLGIKLTYKDLIANKIVLNLTDLLAQNNINRLTRHPNIVEQLDKYFIGFLSYDNGFVNMRRICDEGQVYESIDKRYINYNLFNSIDNSLRFYVLPTTVNLLERSIIHVWITEGPFDILSVKYNLSDIPGQHVHLSVGGKSYLTAIKFIIENLGLINISLHLCPDGDISDWTMKKIASYLSPFNLPINTHRNMFDGQKDFGVTAGEINEVISGLNKGYQFFTDGIGNLGDLTKVWG